MKRLNKEQVIRIHSMLIDQTGGSDGIRDEGLLESALNAPFQTFDGDYIYRTIKAKAAKLGYFLVKNHPFIDGNKRIGILVMITFLEINGVGNAKVEKYGTEFLRIIKDYVADHDLHVVWNSNSY